MLVMGRRRDRIGAPDDRVFGAAANTEPSELPRHEAIAAVARGAEGEEAVGPGTNVGDCLGGVLVVGAHAMETSGLRRMDSTASASRKTSPTHMRTGPSARGRGSRSSCASVVKWRFSAASVALSTSATGVEPGFPVRMRSDAIDCDAPAAMYNTTLSASIAAGSHSDAVSSRPTRGVRNATVRATPRRVREILSVAAAASAAVMPGTTSTSMPAACKASISSWARPKSIGSPPLRRTTSSWVRAASIRARMMKRCSVETLPYRLPTSILRAFFASASVSGCTSASCSTMSADSRRRAARSVRRSGAPGPAPTRYTLPTWNLRDHSARDGVVRRLVHEDEAAGRAIVHVAVGGDGLRDADAHGADVVERERLRLGVCLQRLEIQARMELLDARAHALRAVLEPIAAAGRERVSVEPREARIEPACGRGSVLDVGEHVAARDVHLPVEHHGDRSARGRGAQRPVEGHDLVHAGLVALGRGEHRIAHVEHARLDPSEISAMLPARAEAGARHELHRQSKMRARASRLGAFEYVEERRAFVPTQVLAAAHHHVAFERRHGNE